MSNQTSSPISANLSYRDLVALEVMKVMLNYDGIMDVVGRHVHETDDPESTIKVLKSGTEFLAQTCFLFADSMDNARLRKKLKPTSTEEAFKVEKEVIKINQDEVKDGNPKE